MNMRETANPDKSGQAVKRQTLIIHTSLLSSYLLRLPFPLISYFLLLTSLSYNEKYKLKNEQAFSVVRLAFRVKARLTHVRSHGRPVNFQ